MKRKVIFKRILVLLLAVTLFGNSFSMIPTATSSVRYGDLTSDDKINATDALFVLKAAVKKLTPTEDQITAGDVNGDKVLNAEDALLILKYAVGKIKVFPIEEMQPMTDEERYYYQLNQSYHVDFSDFDEISTFENLDDTTAMVEALGGDPKVAAVEGYEVKNGKLSYTPLSREAKRKGDLTKYNAAEKVTGTIKTGSTTLTYSIPKNVTAYDVVPVTYSVYSNTTQPPVHIEAVAFEEAERSKGKSYYDGNMPGKVAMQLDYEGYVSASNNNGKPILSANPEKDIQGSAFPAYNPSDLIRSGTIKANDYTWLKFKFVNTGNTILDGEGNSSFWFVPHLYQYQNGSWVSIGDGPVYPFLDYVYPGESGEYWVYFAKEYCKALEPGDYRVEINGYLRSEVESYHANAMTSAGKLMTSSTFEFAVTRDGTQTEPKPVKNSAGSSPKRNGWLADFEEFMSSYTSLFEVGKTSSNATTGVLYVQPAPFTKQIVIKLLEGNTASMASAAIPVTVDTSSIHISLNPYNTNYVMKADGTRTPMIMTQNMADMRVNVLRGPNTDDIMLNDLRNMQEAGINTLTTTHAYTGDYTGFYDMSMYMLDCARKLGFKLEGHALYPYRNQLAINRVKAGDPSAQLGGERDIFGFRQLDAANGILARWNLIRYGDFYYYNPENNTVPISVEDNFGWMNSVLNCRFGIANSYSDRLLYKWLEKAYNGDIGALNQKYGSSYSKFSDITLSNQGGTPQNADHEGLILNNSSATYHDWNAATMELDIFRTTEHVRNYQEMLRTLDVPSAKISLRSENNLFLAGGISQTTDNAHYRRIYYEQRRAAMIPEVLAASDIIYADSSYNAWAFTDSEVYELTRQAAKTGFVTAKTPPFNHMYDDAINDYLGSIQYDDYLSLGSAQKSVTMCRNGSLFTYWKAMYEAGGIPGTMWMDYVCDLYVTTTQYKEMLFFKQKIEEMLATDEGKAWATAIPENAEKSPISNIAAGAYSYPESYIENKTQTIPRVNRILDFCN